MVEYFIFIIIPTIFAAFGLGILYSSWKLCPLAQAAKRLMRDDPDGWETDEQDIGYHKEMGIKVNYHSPKRNYYNNNETFGTIQINDVKLDILEGYRIRLALRKLRGRKIIRDFKQSKQRKIEDLQRKKAAEIDAIIEGSNGRY